MKLKKIASLMLAGIMAVSMLAGCKSGTPVDDGSSSSQVPTVTNVVTYANDMLSGSEKEVFTFVGSSELDTILNDVATDTTKLNSSDISRIFGSTGLVNGQLVRNNAQAEARMLKAIEGKLDGIVTSDFTDPIVSNVKTQKKVELYTISGAFEEKAAVQKAVDNYSNYIAGSFPANVGTNECDYTAEISALKVASPEDSEETAWVIAMVFTQTVTSKANEA